MVGHANKWAVQLSGRVRPVLARPPESCQADEMRVCRRQAHELRAEDLPEPDLAHFPTCEARDGQVPRTGYWALAWLSTPMGNQELPEQSGTSQTYSITVMLRILLASTELNEVEGLV